MFWFQQTRPQTFVVYQLHNINTFKKELSGTNAFKGTSTDVCKIYDLVSTDEIYTHCNHIVDKYAVLLVVKKAFLSLLSFSLG